MHRASAQPLLHALMRAVSASLSDVWIDDGTDDAPPPEVAELCEKWGATFAEGLKRFDPTTYSEQTGAPITRRLEEWAYQSLLDRDVDETAEILLHADELMQRARDEHKIWHAELASQDRGEWDDLAAAWERRSARTDPELRAHVETERPSLTETEEAAVGWIALPLAAISDISQAPVDEFLLAKIARRSFGARGSRAERLAAELDSRARDGLRRLYGDLS